MDGLKGLDLVLSFDSLTSLSAVLTLCTQHFRDSVLSAMLAFLLVENTFHE